MATKSKPKRKPNYPTITFSVGRFRFLFFKGKRISWGRMIDELGITSLEIQTYKTENKVFDTPAGAYGGPIAYNDKQAVIDFFKGLLDKHGVEYEDDDVKIVVRYHVLDDDRITCDVPPAPGSGGLRDYTKNKGYKKEINAEAAAEGFFKYYCSWLLGENKKMIQKVQLVLYDDMGKVKLKKTSN